MDQYLTFMNREVASSGRRITIKLQFLSHSEEARLEHKALYELNYASNKAQVEALLRTDQGATFENTVILSVGSSSTQAYAPKGVIGRFHFGTSQLPDNRMMATLVEKLQHFFAHHDIKSVLIIGSAGYWIKQESLSHINVLDEPSMEDLVRDEKGAHAFLRQLGPKLRSVQPKLNVYLKNRKPRDKNIHLSWLGPLTQEIRGRVGHEQHGHYLVDFGGGGVEVHCLRCDAQPWKGKDRFLKNYIDAQGQSKDLQQDFVQAVTTLEHRKTNWIVQMAQDRIVELALRHAQEKTMQGPICIEVYQTGRLREAYEKTESIALLDDCVIE